MPLRNTIRSGKLRPRCLKGPADGPKSAELLTGGEFEVISWLAATGVSIAVTLAAAYSALDPAAALLGQFP